MSRLPPFSRGGTVRSPAAATGGKAVSGRSPATGPPAARMRSSRARCRSISSWDGATPITPAWTHGGHRDPRQLSGARVRPVELPADEERLGEEVGEEAEAGDDPVHAEVRGLVPDELDLEHVARLCPLDVDRPGQRVSEPEVEPPAVGVRARARQRPVEPVARLERELVAGGDARHRLEVGVPAVVRGGRGDPHRRPADPLRGARGRRDLVLRPPSRARRAGGARGSPPAGPRGGPASRSAPRGRRMPRASPGTPGRRRRRRSRPGRPAGRVAPRARPAGSGGAPSARRGGTRRRARAPPRRPGTPPHRECRVEAWPGSRRWPPAARRARRPAPPPADYPRAGEVMLAGWRSTVSARS